MVRRCAEAIAGGVGLADAAFAPTSRLALDVMLVATGGAIALAGSRVTRTSARSLSGA